MADSKSKTIERDPADVGVPMLPGDPSEPQGPEDALGTGAKRGDYTDRVGPQGYNPHEVVPAKDGVAAVPQRPRAEEQGDAKGLKGGVET